jgi:hypothetical protein
MTSPPPERFRLLKLEDLEREAPPTDLITGLVGDDDLVVLYGASGVGKSFAGLWCGFCVSEGIPFLGHAVRPGPVVMIVLEGGRRYRYRVRAACDALDLPAPTQLSIIRDPLYAHMADSILAYIAAIRSQRNGAPLALTVLDTLARASAGSDENKNADRELTLDGLRAIQRETGGALIAIAHTGWNEDRLRGGYTVQANADLILKLSRNESTAGLTLEVEKSREGESGARFPVALSPVGQSLVFGPADCQENAGELTPAAVKAIGALEAIALSDGVTSSVWGKASGLPDSTFFRVRKQLIAAGRVQVLSRGRHVVAPNGGPPLP